MEDMKTGMLARSKAGHDKGEVFLILDTDDLYVYLADGKNKTIDNPKKKKKKHIQIINKHYDLENITDVKIKRILKLWYKEEN